MHRTLLLELKHYEKFFYEGTIKARANPSGCTLVVTHCVLEKCKFVKSECAREQNVLAGETLAIARGFAVIYARARRVGLSHKAR